MHSDPQGKSESRVHRERQLTGRAIIVIVIEKREREPTREREINCDERDSLPETLPCEVLTVCTGAF